MVKFCNKCKTEKELSEFSKDKRNKCGLKSQCKSCEREYKQSNKEIIKEWRKEYNKEYYQANKEKMKEYYQANKERMKEYQKEYKKQYRQANKEKIKESNKEYREANKEYYKEYFKEYHQVNKEKINEMAKEYQRERRKTDPLFKMKCNLRNRTWKAFKNKGYSKNTRTQKILGVDWEVAKQHIERQFKKGMNWNNQGEWHIDHIIPLASANTLERLEELSHYTNLQPMWAIDNLIKNDKIIGQQTLLRI